MLKDLLIENERHPYVILDHWELLAQDTLSHIDLLVLNKPEFVKALELSVPKDKKDHYRFGKKIGLHRYIFTLRTLEDDYFPKDAAERLLKGRVKSEEEVYIPHPSDRFWSLLYRATYHRNDLTLDDSARLIRWLPQKFKATIGDRVAAHHWLCDQGFFPVKCKDPEVSYFIPE